jgi:hypothetical protein
MTAEDRSRLVAAVLHFALIKGGLKAKQLFRSLYVFDVLHFQATGRTAMGLEYLAGDFGPYPIALSQELGEHLRRDLTERISVTRLREGSGNDLIHPLTEQDALGDLFSPRELKLLAQVDALLAQHGDLESVVPGLDNGAWSQALKKKKHSSIAMEETVADGAPNRAGILQQAAEYKGRSARMRALAA